jgi:hypothetical protein
MIYKIVIRQVSTGIVRTRIAKLGQKQFLELREMLNAPSRDYVLIDIIELPK